LVAVAVLLFLLWKKKKAAPPPDENLVEDELSGTFGTGENEKYISEYGLSDGGRPLDGASDHAGRSRAATSDQAYHSDVEHVSEHNPEDIEDALDPCAT
jgi:hypothetical protein